MTTLISDQDSLDDESNDSGRTFQGDHGEHTSQIDTNNHSHSHSSLVPVAQSKRNDSTHRFLPHPRGFPKLSEKISYSQPRHKNEMPRSRIASTSLAELGSKQKPRSRITYPLLTRRENPFFKAAKMGDTETLKILLQKGANIEARTYGDNQTALHLAADGGHQAAIQFLLDKGANIEARDPEVTALYLAVAQRHQAAILLLLERGAKITMGELDVAARKGSEAVMRLLLDRGADCNVRVCTNVSHCI